jgi:serine/threonine-protein kinase
MAFVGQDDASLDAAQRAAELGLTDLLWLDRCPLLDTIRAKARYPRIHAEVARRTEAILEAYRS